MALPPIPTSPSASRWVVAHAQLIPQTASVLDLACGNGRHTQYLRDLGLAVVAVDKNLQAMDTFVADEKVELLQVDLETDKWALAGRTFAGIVATNYLYRPHTKKLINNLTPDGVLIYETFAVGNEQFGRPSNPAYLLKPNELMEIFGSRLHIIAYEQLTENDPKPAVKQRICAVGRQHPLVAPM